VARGEILLTARSVSWQQATVAETHLLSPRTNSILLRVPDWRGNLAGQHVDIRLTADDGYQAVRSYSIASTTSNGTLELAVDRLPAGEVSPYLVDAVRPGDNVEVLGPLGRWFVWEAESPEPVQLIAGGSGIVPLMAMMRARREAHSKAPFRLLYSVRSPEDVLFKSDLAKFEKDFPVAYIYTRTTPAGWERPASRLSAEDVRRTVFAPNSSARAYVCGSTGFVESVTDALATMGYGEDRVRAERYGGA